MVRDGDPVKLLQGPECAAEDCDNPEDLIWYENNRKHVDQMKVFLHRSGGRGG